MQVVVRHPLLDERFATVRDVLGADWLAYRNHAYRVFNFCRTLTGRADEERIALAAFFHDLGIWTHHTFDYLEPSAEAARRYLLETDRAALVDDVVEMIRLHHKLTRAAAPLAEAFRTADLTDVSLGLLHPGLPRSFVREVRTALPNAGFHRRLLALGATRLRHHPLDPLPMLRW